MTVISFEEQVRSPQYFYPNFALGFLKHKTLYFTWINCNVHHFFSFQNYKNTTLQHCWLKKTSYFVFLFCTWNTLEEKTLLRTQFRTVYLYSQVVIGFIVTIITASGYTNSSCKIENIASWVYKKEWLDKTISGSSVVVSVWRGIREYWNNIQYNTIHDEWNRHKTCCKLCSNYPGQNMDSLKGQSQQDNSN